MPLLIPHDALPTIDPWALQSARREIAAAVDALELAGSSLIGLRPDVRWESDGVRGLLDLMERFIGRTSAEAGALQARLWELTAAEAT
ncbi:hypothetical protein [Microbacterium sp. 179-I 3D3 NHS]|uniref:hypothetical protein n=1 Tax=unclassified Microbacterium TaxID=2609290 RepID=UPI0039A24A46